MVAPLPRVEIEQRLIRASYSAINTHRQCEAKFLYRYILRIQQPRSGPAPYLHFGSWWGALTAAEGLERGRKLGSLKWDEGWIQGPDDATRFSQKTVTVADVLGDADRWWKERDQDTKEAWLEAFTEPLPTRLRRLFVSWMKRWAEERKTEHPLAYELEVRRPLPMPTDSREWLGSDQDALDQIEGLGYLDEVYYDTVRKIVVVRDRKSHKQLKPHSALTDMMDSQLQYYIWLGTPIIQKWGLGTPKATSYDRARSTPPKLPEITKTAGALSKGVTDYDVQTYVKWANTDTRPLDEIAKWLEKALPSSTADLITGEITHNDPEIVATKEQIDYVRSLPPGQFYTAAKPDESPIQFLVSGVRKGNPKFGVYEIETAVVDRLSTPVADSTWFQRTRPPVNRNVVIEHLRAMVDTSIDAWRTKRRAELTGDAPRSLTKDCEWCDYVHLCRARMFGGPLGEYDLVEFGLQGPRELDAEGKETGKFKNLLTDGRLVVRENEATGTEDLEDLEDVEMG